jgi:hypothetical protein
MAWEGEVASRWLGNNGATHLTPALSPRKRAERERMAVDDLSDVEPAVCTFPRR